MESDEELAARRLGQVVGRFRLERVLGVGGMAAVYAARAPDGSVAALKLLHPEMSLRRDVRERFFREGYVANSIQHPGVVRALEHGEAGDTAYLAMELLNGETLSDRVKRHGTLPIDELLNYADQVLDVLVIAHDKGIVHRDLKPDNLFVTQDGRIKILDFGLARLIESAPGNHRTQTGMALGTLPYMAPEQALGRRDEIDGRVDLFAVGASLFRILSGRRIHEGNSEAELLIAMASKPAPSLSSAAPHVPSDIGRVVDMALAFSRDARYPDARTMQADLRAVRAGQRPPYASHRFSAREQKTLMDSAPAVPPSSRNQATMPLHEHAARSASPPPASGVDSNRTVPVSGFGPAPPPNFAPRRGGVEPTLPLIARPARRGSRLGWVVALVVLLLGGGAALAFQWQASARGKSDSPSALAESSPATTSPATTPVAAGEATPTPPGSDPGPGAPSAGAPSKDPAAPGGRSSPAGGNPRAEPKALPAPPAGALKPAQAGLVGAGSPAPSPPAAPPAPPAKRPGRGKGKHRPIWND